MLRLGLIVALVAAVSHATHAQVALGDARSPGITVRPAPPSPPPTPPHRRDPAPSRPHARHDAIAGAGDLFLAHPRTYAPDFGRPRGKHLARPLSPYALPLYPFPVVPAFPIFMGTDREGYADDAPHPEGGRAQRARSTDRNAAPANGYVRFDVQPQTAQVYVDGFFVGTVADVAPALPLAPGLHRVELEAAGFGRVAVDVRVRSGETATFARTLDRSPRAGERVEPPAAAAPPAAKTLYVIPRCYAGDRRPSAADLPPGCRLADLRAVGAGN